MSTLEQATTMSLARYAEDSRALVAGAQAMADARRHAEVQPLHLLARALERDPGVVEVFRRATPRHVELTSAVEKALEDLPLAKESAYLSAAMLDLLERAEREADRERSKTVLVEHLMNALSQEIRGPAGEILGAFGVGPGSLRPHMKGLYEVPREVARTSSSSNGFRDLVAEARLGERDPVIGRVAELRRLITILERRQKSHPLLVGEPGVGKRAVVRALAARIAQGDIPTRLANLKLLEVDTGSLVAGARLRGEVELRVKQLLDKARNTAGEAVLVVESLEQLFGQGPSGSAVGDLLRPALARGEVRWLAVTTPEGLRRIEERDPQVLRWFTTLAIDEPSIDQAIEIIRGIAGRLESHHQVNISEGAIVASVRLAKRYLQDRFLPDTALDLLDEAAAAMRVEVDGIPRDVDEAIARLASLKAQLGSLADAEDETSRATSERLQAEANQLEPTVRALRDRLDARRASVGAMVTLRAKLEETRAELERARASKDYARLGKLEHGELPLLQNKLADAEKQAREAGVALGDRQLKAEDVAGTLALWTGVPVQKMLEGEADKLLKMEERLSQRVVGQEDAVRAIAKAVRRSRVGLRDPKKPIGSFLFLGPSGVGKTELAKALASFLFDDEQALTRLDMSEFMERHMAQRLIGAPPGYADAEKGGFLTEAVRQRPYSVLLFDEVEKAHGDVFNLLLQVLDDGRLTDGRGRTADFSNTVIIMTSNIGSERILETDSRLFESAEGREALRDVLLENLNAFFKPEFLNRVDDVVVFRPLTKEVLRKIVDIELGGVARLLTERRVELEISDAVKAHLVSLGYEPALGARPLKRAILREVQDPLAEALLSGAYAEQSKVRVELENEVLTFNRVE
jgi:ATP-dependent Clp protease ATP-binding subunit ClpB